MKMFLVCAALKKHIKAPDNNVVEFYTVEADDEFTAKRKAWDLFLTDYQYNPWVKKFLAQFPANLSDITVSDCVEL